MKKTYAYLGIIVVLFVIIIVLIINRSSSNPVSSTPIDTTASSTPVTATTTSPSETANIKVSSPLPNSSLKSPVTITGTAKGTWYFEASFPAKIVDANGKVLAQAPAQAQGDWMTSDFVPFTVTLTFSQPTTATGSIILEKDNPSGLPQNADSITIPVTFSK